MLWTRSILVGAIMVFLCAPAASGAGVGRVPSSAEIKLWDIDVKPNGTGLPDGSGTATHGKDVYEQNCSACHGEKGEGGIGTPLVGGLGSLASGKPVKTVGSFWPYSTTLFDYIRRAMPYTTPQSLSADDTYAVTAYILSMNKIIPASATLSRATLPGIKMPNRNGFVPDDVFKLDNENPAARRRGAAH